MSNPERSVGEIAAEKLHEASWLCYNQNYIMLEIIQEVADIINSVSAPSEAAGERLVRAVDAIRVMLYGLALDARQACIAQKAIDEAVEAARLWREIKSL